jgi:hypothetical protein
MINGLSLCHLSQITLSAALLCTSIKPLTCNIPVTLFD